MKLIKSAVLEDNRTRIGYPFDVCFHPSDNNEYCAALTSGRTWRVKRFGERPWPNEFSKDMPGCLGDMATCVEVRLLDKHSYFCVMNP